MRYLITIILIAILSFIYGEETKAQTIRRLDDGTVNALNSNISSLFNSNNLTGLSVGVIYGGEVVYTYALGNATSFTPFTTSTKTVIGSVSKTITALLAVRLVQNGDIGLDDPISNYIAYPNGSNITIRHLLAHQSGIGHYDNCPGGYNGQFNWASSVLVVSGCTHCVTPPGAATLYTTFGTTLLGCIIDRVGVDVYGRTYRQLYDDWIQTPAGLDNLTPEFDDSEPLLANGYTQGGSAKARGWNDIGWRLPAGGFVSDITDLAGYGRGIIRNTFVNSGSATTMRQVQGTAGGATVNCGSTGGNFGLGFSVSGSGDNVRISHTGLNDHGYSTLLYLYPLKGCGIVLLCNNDDQTDALDDIRSAVEDLVVCPDTRNFTNALSWTAPRIYEADNDITASAPITTTGGEVIFDARSVTLKPGFEVLSGKIFRAVAEGCGGTVKSY
jgi:D-alanyl-D-alanine carboxypeptidase